MDKEQTEDRKDRLTPNTSSILRDMGTPLSVGANFSFKKIIWAVDAFSDRKNYERLHEQREVIDSIRALAGAPGPLKTPLDPSTPSTSAASTMEVIPVFVLDDIQEDEAPYHGDARESLTELMESARGESFDGLCQPVMLDAVKPPFFTEQKSAHALVEYAKEVGADLIVCFVSEAPGIAAWFKGSFSESVAEESEIPVLLVGAHRHLSQSTRKIALPVDFNLPSDEPLECALDIAAQLDAHLTILDLKETGSKRIMKKVFGSDESEERWMRWCELVKRSKIEHEVYSLEFSGKASSATARYVRDSDIDLVVVSSAMVGGEILDLARKSTASVLVMRFTDSSKRTAMSSDHSGVDAGEPLHDKH